MIQIDSCDLPAEFIIERIEVPKNQVHLLVKRRPNESLIQWAKRCAVAYNVGTIMDGS